MSEIAWTAQDRTRYHAIFSLLEGHLDEKTTRLLGAAMALSLGHGGQTLMHEVTGLAMDTLQLGVAQLQGETPLADDRIRRDFQSREQPVISVDAKKKEELVGNYKNEGKEYHPTGHPVEVLAHDFPNRELGKATPYGVYEPGCNVGWVTVGTDHDTAQFAVASIRQWWQRMGQAVYPTATELLITADGGGSNGSRTKLWKVELQKLADEIGLALTVSHFPPVTSKWNKI